ncbi:MAG: hypothetical protein ACXVJD_05500 [Mucilaginibacter sp.]
MKRLYRKPRALAGDRSISLSAFVTDITDKPAVEGLLEKVIKNATVKWVKFD